MAIVGGIPRLLLLLNFPFFFLLSCCFFFVNDCFPLIPGWFGPSSERSVAGKTALPSARHCTAVAPRRTFVVNGRAPTAGRHVIHNVKPSNLVVSDFSHRRVLLVTWWRAERWLVESHFKSIIGQIQFSTKLIRISFKFSNHFWNNKLREEFLNFYFFLNFLNVL